MSPPPPSYAQDAPLPPDIHLVLDGADTGPLDETALIRLVADGRIGPSTLAWHPALDSWAEIAKLPELAALLMPPAVPEVAAPECVLAGFTSRVAAGGIDMAIWLALASLMTVPLEMTAVLTDGNVDPALAERFNLMAQVVAVVYFVVPMSALGGGATFGYRLLGLRLVAAESLQPPGVIRTFVWYIVTYVRFLGWVTYFIDSKRRMLHNIISGTLVITIRGATR